MGFIDVAIPAIGGLYFLLVPLKDTGDAAKDAQRRMLLRGCGVALLCVSALYLLIKVAGS